LKVGRRENIINKKQERKKKREKNKGVSKKGGIVST
jgi:hypothetical protein